MTDKSVSQVALPAGTSITAPSISASSVTHQGTRSLLCGVSPVPGSVGTGAFWFLATSALLFMSGKARKTFPARKEAKAAAKLRTHPSLSL